MIVSWFSPCTFSLKSFRCCEIRPKCVGFNVSAVSEIVDFLFGLAGHLTTRRGPDVARGPDVVHHWCKAFLVYWTQSYKGQLLLLLFLLLLILLLLSLLLLLLLLLCVCFALQSNDRSPVVLNN